MSSSDADDVVVVARARARAETTETIRYETRGSRQIRQITKRIGDPPTTMSRLSDLQSSEIARGSPR